MSKEPETRTTLDRFADLFMAIIFIISLLAVSGWLLNKPILASLSRRSIPMAPATAILFLGLFGSWFIHRIFPARDGIRIGVQASLVGMLIIVLILVTRSITGIGPDLEKWLFQTPPLFGQIPTGRMSPQSALGFILAIPALFLLTGRKPSKRTKSVAGGISMVGFILSGLLMLGYLYNTPLFYGGTTTPVSLPGAQSYILLFLVLIIMAGPSSWPLRTYAGHSLRARFMRTFIPASILVVLFQGYLSTAADPWLLNPAIKVAVAAQAASLIVVTIISLVVRNISADFERSNLARLKAENTLKQSESSLQAVLQSTADGILAVGRENEVLYTNKRFAELWQIPQAVIASKDDSILLKHVLDQLSDPQSFLKKVQELYQSDEESYDFLDFKDGRKFERVSRALIQGESVQGRVWSFRDVTERKRSAEALAKSESELRALFAGMTDVVIVYDINGRYVEIAPTNPANLYRPQDEMLGKTVQDILPKEQADSIIATIREAIQTDQVIQNEYSLQIDGKEAWFSASASRLSDTTAVWVAHDITNRKRASEDLERLSRINELVLDSSAEGILGLDSKGNHTFINQAAAKMLGYEVEELIGHPSHSTWHHTKPDGSPYPKEECNIYASYRDGKVHHTSSEVFWRKDGTSFPVEYFSTPIREQGRLTGAVVSFADITERKHYELVQDVIFRITQAEFTSEGIDSLYKSIHSILGELFLAENFYIALIDPDKGLITFPYYVDQFDELPPAPTPIQGLTGYVVRTGKPLLATREVYARLVEQGEVEPLGTAGEDWMGAPLKAEGRMIGVMAVQSYSKGVHFNQEDLNLLEFVSTQVANVIERKRMEREIIDLSLKDELTGLYNRRGFDLLAEQEMKLARRFKRSALLYFCDVDNLKTINDTFGHAQGDLALKEVSTILKDVFREADIPARFGGDEFVILAPDASLDSADNILKRIQDNLERSNQKGQRPYHLTFSMGFSRFDPEAPCTLSELITQADSQMYQLKQTRK